MSRSNKGSVYIYALKQETAGRHLLIDDVQDHITYLN